MSVTQTTSHHCLLLANHLAENCKIPQVRTITDIDSCFFVKLFEKITGHEIQDLVVCSTQEDHAHNIQAVIDALSLDILGISLSHIIGEEVARYNILALCNLLEVLDCVQKCTMFEPMSNEDPQAVKNAESQAKKCIFTDSESSSIDKKYGLSDSTGFKDLRCSSSTSSSSSTFIQRRRNTLKTRECCMNREQSNRGGKYLSTSSSTSLSSVHYPESNRGKSTPESTDDGLSGDLPFSVSSTSDTTDQEVSRINITIRTDNDTVLDSNKPLVVIDVETNKNNEGKTSPRAHTSRVLKRKVCRLPLGRTIEKSRSPKKSEKAALHTKMEIENIYENNLEQRLKILLEKSPIEKRATRLSASYLKSLRRSPRRRSISSCHKSYLLPHSLRRQSGQKMSHKRRLSSSRDASFCYTGHQNDQSLTSSSDANLLQNMLSEFPHANLSSNVLKRLAKKYEDHLWRMHSKVKSCLSKKPKITLQTEESAAKQSALSSLLKKDLADQKRVTEAREKKFSENAMSYRLRDARLKTARMKVYHDEFRSHMRKKMAKKNFEEELVLQDAFDEAMKIQRQHVDRLCAEAEEARGNDARQHSDYLAALENLYMTQFQMLSETLAAQNDENKLRSEAEAEDLRKIKKDMEEALKSEIRFMQNVIVDSTDDIHFRKMDAELFKDRLRDKYL